MGFSVDNDNKEVTLFSTFKNVEYSEAKKKELHHWVDKVFSIVSDSYQNTIARWIGTIKKR